MKAEQLRKTILQMAIQGKLVPQDPNDEPASVLLEKIRAEKQKLIKAGKIKKDKVNSVIFRGEDNRHYEKVGDSEPVCIEDGLPFEIPESWEWTRLGTLFQHNTGKALNSSNTKGISRQYITTSNLYWGFFKLDNLREMLFTDEETKKCSVSKGDLLVCEGGDIGRAAIWNYDYSMCIQNHIHKLRPYYSVSSDFYYYIFCVYKNSGLLGGKGIGIQGLSSNMLDRLLIPLPPLDEQSRIVSGIEKYEPLIAEYDKFEQQKSKLDSEIYDKLKKSILQYAIQGKLVPQDENDEPASELLKRIRAKKKAQLGKKYVDSYIYKGDDNCYYEKIGAEVKNITEEIPFDIAKKWEWMRLKQIIDFSKNSSISSEQIPDDAWVLDLEDIEKDSGKIIKKKQMREVKAKSDKHAFYQGDVLYSKLRPYLNKVIVADEDGFCTSEILAFDFSPIMSEYAQVYLMSPFFVDYAMNGVYGVKMPRIGSERGNNALMPLPPLDEQKRIVLRLNELFDKLKDEV